VLPLQANLKEMLRAEPTNHHTAGIGLNTQICCLRCY